LAFHLTVKSTNQKTGPIPVSTSGKETCPTACPYRGTQGCYAEYGPLAVHWRKVTEGTRGEGWISFLRGIIALPEGQLWRHNQAGDLIPDAAHRGEIGRSFLLDLVRANQGKRGFTYTHYDVEGESSHNRDLIKIANSNGFTINLSANSLTHADQLAALETGPVCTLLPSDTEVHSLRTPEGRRVTVCPAFYRDTTCQECQLCAMPKRKTIIGFPAHGTKKREIDRVLRR
jgi:hypothetical protein